MGVAEIKIRPNFNLENALKIFTVGADSQFGVDITVPGRSGLVFSHGDE
jgi:hypothetical protein